MAENRFDDTRKSIAKVVNIFFKESKSTFRNVKFEEVVMQVINRKSIKNFELFAHVFDLIYDMKLKNLDEFKTYMNQFSEVDDTKTVYKLYYDTKDIDERDLTVEYAFDVYNQHLSLIKKFEEVYMAQKKVGTLKMKDYFDESFFSKEYKFINIRFDIFLSHRYYLKFYNIIIFYILTVFYDLVVYVDWIFDYQVDRKKLDQETVKLLKYRMKQSKKQVFYNILNSSTTNWMAWEVGYFSCLKENSIAILDLDGYCKGNKNVEVLSSNDRILYDSQKGLYLEQANVSIKQWINS